jgi:hypothetical protein
MFSRDVCFSIHAPMEFSSESLSSRRTSSFKNLCIATLFVKSDLARVLGALQK